MKNGRYCAYLKKKGEIDSCTPATETPNKTYNFEEKPGEPFVSSYGMSQECRGNGVVTEACGGGAGKDCNGGA